MGDYQKVYDDFLADPGAHRSTLGDRVCRQTAKDPQRQDHAPCPEGKRARHRSRGHINAGGMRGPFSEDRLRKYYGFEYEKTRC